MNNTLASNSNLPSCNELSMYDSRILSKFICSIGVGFNQKEIKDFYDTFRSPNAAEEFIAGLAKGLYKGCSEAIDDYIVSTLQLLAALGNAEIKFYEMVYSPELFADIIKVYAQKNDAKDRSQALLEFSEKFKEKYPEAASMFSNLALVEPALIALAEWFNRKDAVYEVMSYLSAELGTILGDELRVIKAYIKMPEALGRELGRIIGEAMAQIALFFLGV